MMIGERGGTEFLFGVSGYRSVYISAEVSPMHFKFLRLIFSRDATWVYFKGSSRCKFVKSLH